MKASVVIISLTILFAVTSQVIVYFDVQKNIQEKDSLRVNYSVRLHDGEDDDRDDDRHEMLLSMGGEVIKHSLDDRVEGESIYEADQGLREMFLSMKSKAVRGGGFVEFEWVEENILKNFTGYASLTPEHNIKITFKKI